MGLILACVGIESIPSQFERRESGDFSNPHTTKTTLNLRIQIARPARTYRSALSSAVKLAVAGVGKRPQDGAGALMDYLTYIHGEGENKDEKEQIDAKQRMQ